MFPSVASTADDVSAYAYTGMNTKNVSATDLQCGKLAQAESKSATRVEIERNTFKGIKQAVKHLHKHGKKIAANSQLIADHNKYGINGNTNSVNG